jgi:hypothetical protein
VDIAIIGENAQAQLATAVFWMIYYKGDVCKNDLSTCEILAQKVGGLPFFGSGGELFTTIPLPSGSPPQPYVLGGLTLPFAPNPTKPALPKCGAGQELISSGPGAFSCAVIPKHLPPAATPRLVMPF